MACRIEYIDGYKSKLSLQYLYLEVSALEVWILTETPAELLFLFQTSLFLCHF